MKKGVESKDIACVILAAGFSRRFGGDKLRAVLPGGDTVFTRSVDIYNRVFSQLYAVVRPDMMRPKTNSDVIYILNDQAQQGMSQSIVSAVKHLNPELGWLFALADMPYLRADTVRKITQAAHADAIVQPLHGNKPGNPVFFGRRYRDKLLNLNGDAGARGLIQEASSNIARSDAVVQVTVNDPGIHHDIDCPADMQAELA